MAHTIWYRFPGWKNRYGKVAGEYQQNSDCNQADPELWEILSSFVNNTIAAISCIKSDDGRQNQGQGGAGQEQGKKDNLKLQRK